jgi:hypothetical protein
MVPMHHSAASVCLGPAVLAVFCPNAPIDVDYMIRHVGTTTVTQRRAEEDCTWPFIQMLRKALRLLAGRG